MDEEVSINEMDSLGTGIVSSSSIIGPENSSQIGEGDSRIAYEVFTLDADFEGLKNEIQWQKMYHAFGEVPRLVCCQGLIDPNDGSKPVYRHPSDQSLPLLPFSPVVQTVKVEVERLVGHVMNHVLIQLYRSGEDHITEHSDKTLDIVRGSLIVNASFGAQRTMRLRTKKSHPDQERRGRQTQLIQMTHGSVFILGPNSNMRWLHGIKYDRRPASERSAAETAFGGERISLTFRNIGTYLDARSETIWGQGATGKSREDARPVVNGCEAETQRMINAFGYENQSSSFDWEDVYGGGFDVLHFRNP